MPSGGLPKNFLTKVDMRILYLPSKFHVVLGSKNTITVMSSYGTYIQVQVFLSEHCDLRSSIRIRDCVFHNE
jgi:hypothetical protein